MEETLGKRIVFHRKRLGLTQDALAELMGVTAQAVSKWENDQSCPDIGALPKLAEIFGISTDELLGVEQKEVHPAEIVPADGEENDVHSHPEMTWELSLDDGKKGGIGLAVWILLVGGIMLTSYLLNFHAKLWDVVWPSALLVFGIFGLFPRFSFFRLGCSLFGLYFLMSNLNFAPFRLGREFLLPVLLLLFGGSLLVDTIRKSKNGTHNSGCFSFHPTRNGGRKKEHCTCTGNFFDCDTAFGENHYTILLPTLGGGKTTFHIPEGTQNDAEFRIKGQGIQQLRGNIRGDLVLHIRVEVPKRLTEKQKELLRQFEEATSGKEYETRKSFLDKVKDIFNS